MTSRAEMTLSYNVLQMPVNTDNSVYRQRIRGFLKWYALYKSTFYLLTYLLLLIDWLTEQALYFRTAMSAAHTVSAIAAALLPLACNKGVSLKRRLL